ncbi:hypothetical protein ACFWNH_30510 [Rhodococcus qingshengii]|uniref:hypothetical protein n=1 Tax=Rhodococcus qingshengii TaxID=334542 RepID=UPI00365B63AD
MAISRVFSFTATVVTIIAASVTLISCISVEESLKDAWAIRYVVESNSLEVVKDDISYKAAPHRGASAQAPQETVVAYPWATDTTNTDKRVARITATPLAGQVSIHDKEKVPDQHFGTPGRRVASSATPPESNRSGVSSYATTGG